MREAGLRRRSRRSNAILPDAYTPDAYTVENDAWRALFTNADTVTGRAMRWGAGGWVR